MGQLIGSVEGGDDAAFGRFDSSDWSDPIDISACNFSASPTASSDELGDWTYVNIDTFESNVGQAWTYVSSCKIANFARQMMAAVTIHGSVDEK